MDKIEGLVALILPYYYRKIYLDCMNGGFKYKNEI